MRWLHPSYVGGHLCQNLAQTGHPVGQKSEWRGKSGTILGDFMQYKPWHYGKLSLRGQGGGPGQKFFFR